MNEQKQDTKQDQTTESKPGFFTRIFTKMDSAMKQKAEEKAKSGCCCGDKNDKGGKCC